MSPLPILTGADNAILRAKTKKVSQVTKDILSLIKNMHLTVKKANGLGIAAPQVGRSERLCLALFNGKMNALINPEITWRSEEENVMEEGCLSLPKIGIDVSRPIAIILTYLDEKGEEQERKLTGLDARVTQHEIDHLEGVLIVDYR